MNQLTFDDLRLAIRRWLLAIADRLLPVLTWTTLFLNTLSSAAVTNESAARNQIPPLRPLKPEIPPGFWEQHGLALALTALGGVLVLIGLWRLLARHAPEVPPLPANVARQALERSRRHPVDSQLLSEVSRVLRDYFVAAFELPPREYTNNELCRQLAASKSVGEELASRTAALLQGMDNRRFDPDANIPELDVVEEALHLIDQSEEHMQRQRSVNKTQYVQQNARLSQRREF